MSWSVLPLSLSPLFKRQLKYPKVGVQMVTEMHVKLTWIHFKQNVRIVSKSKDSPQSNFYPSDSPEFISAYLYIMNKITILFFIITCFIPRRQIIPAERRYLDWNIYFQTKDRILTAEWSYSNSVIVDWNIRSECSELCSWIILDKIIKISKTACTIGVSVNFRS